MAVWEHLRVWPIPGESCAGFRKAMTPGAGKVGAWRTVLAPQTLSGGFSHPVCPSEQGNISPGRKQTGPLENQF